MIKMIKIKEFFKETIKTRTGVGGIVVFVIGLLFLIIGLTMKVKKPKIYTRTQGIIKDSSYTIRVEKTRRCNTKKKGKTKCYTTKKTWYDYQLKVEYSYGDGESKNIAIFRESIPKPKYIFSDGSYAGNKFKQGTNFTVFYDPENPLNYRKNQPISNKKTKISFIIVGSLLTTVGIISQISFYILYKKNKLLNL